MRRKRTVGPFVTFENYWNRHARIHYFDCGHVRKNGGKNKHGRGAWREHPTLETAKKWLQGTGLLDVGKCHFVAAEVFDEELFFDVHNDSDR
jgi:hypothetical protein